MKVAFLTSGGIAPCLTSSIGRMIESYSKYDRNIEFIGYKNGYKGLLKGDIINIPIGISKEMKTLYEFGGTFLGNSRVKLSNLQHCIDNEYISKGEIPLEVASLQLMKDKVNVLHVIGGDDTNTTAAELLHYLKKHNYELTVIGLPKTVDNDVYPITQTLGAFTAAEQAAIFFENIVNENTTSSRQLIIHEVMGRNCGWLTAYSAYLYREKLNKRKFLPEIGLHKDKWDIHAVYIPEIPFNLLSEVERLNVLMSKNDCVNIFLSEGAGIENVIQYKTNNNEKISKDAYDHYRLDDINPGLWYGEYFKNKLNCDKVLVQKSGYFSRSAYPNKNDLELIIKHADMAVDCALNKTSGVIGIDEDNEKLSCINFNRIKGRKPFDYQKKWFQSLLQDINQI